MSSVAYALSPAYEDGADVCADARATVREFDHSLFALGGLALAAVCAYSLAQHWPLFGVISPLALTGGALMAARLSSTLRSRLFQLTTVVMTSVEQAKLDNLTRLPNRSFFTYRLDEALSAEKVGELAVAFFDLDGFKDINDTLGHEFGDALLEAAAGRMRSCARPGEVIARLGGDEFSALIAGSDAASRVIEFVEEVVNALQAPFTFNGSVFSVGASAGIAITSVDATSRGEVLRRADVAMYRAKSQSRGTYRIFSEEMDEEVFVKRAVQEKLGQALANNELRLFYQPILCGRTGKLMGAEALVRWPSKDGRSLSPGEFIPVAEDSGQILELGQWALETALERARAWRTVPISVNVSPLQIRHHNFAHMVSDCLVKSGVKPELLKIEITEGVLISHADVSEVVIRQLKSLGVAIVLDDFGAGFSSLGYLRRFSFDSLKIDRSFAWDLHNNASAVHLLRAIVDLSHGLNMTVVAEGVESERQAAILKLLGCDLLQGYYLGEPMSADELERRHLLGVATAPQQACAV